MTARTLRCICIEHGRRCSRQASARAGDVFACNRHARLITMALIDDMLSPQTRRMLAFARWGTAAEGQALVYRMHRRNAA